jgi:hypothetical protein
VRVRIPPRVPLNIFYLNNKGEIMIYVTEFKKDDGKIYCGRVEADSWMEAELIIKQIGQKNEEVIGKKYKLL